MIYVGLFMKSTSEVIDAHCKKDFEKIEIFLLVRRRYTIKSTKGAY